MTKSARFHSVMNLKFSTTTAQIILL